MAVIAKEKPEIVELRRTKHLAAARCEVVPLGAEVHDEESDVAVTEFVMK